MNCEQARQIMAVDFLEKQNRAENDPLHVHFFTCVKCRQFRDELRSLGQVFSQAESYPPPHDWRLPASRKHWAQKYKVILAGSILAILGLLFLWYRSTPPTIVANDLKTYFARSASDNKNEPLQNKSTNSDYYSHNLFDQVVFEESKKNEKKSGQNFSSTIEELDKNDWERASHPSQNENTAVALEKRSLNSDETHHPEGATLKNPISNPENAKNNPASEQEQNLQAPDLQLPLKPSPEQKNIVGNATSLSKYGPTSHSKNKHEAQTNVTSQTMFSTSSPLSQTQALLNQQQMANQIIQATLALLNNKANQAKVKIKQGLQTNKIGEIFFFKVAPPVFNQIYDAEKQICLEIRQ